MSFADEASDDELYGLGPVGESELEVEDDLEGVLGIVQYVYGTKSKLIFVRQIIFIISPQSTNPDCRTSGNASESLIIVASFSCILDHKILVLYSYVYK